MPKKIADETRAKIVELYAHGKLHREIHEETGVCMGTISTICRAAGLDKYHVGGAVARKIDVAPKFPEPEARSRDDSTLVVTARTLTMCGPATGCEYIAGTNMPTVDITLGDWAIQIDVKRLGAFINELQQVKKMIGVA